MAAPRPPPLDYTHLKRKEPKSLIGRNAICLLVFGSLFVAIIILYDPHAMLNSGHKILERV